MEKLDKLKRKNISLAQKIAEEGIVLLENKDNILPLGTEKPIAVFGRGQLDTKTSGSGSGATETVDVVNIVTGLQQLNFELVTEVLDYYKSQISREKAGKKDGISFIDMIEKAKTDENNELPWWYEFWGKYNPADPEFIIEDQLVKKAAQKTDTALLVISRVSGGEECDRRLENDYYLSAAEMKLIQQVHNEFNNIVLILNICGNIDLAWLRDFPNIKGVLNISLPGQVAGIALARVLSGKVTPSGKLPDTYALSYWDYPSAEHFSFNKDKKDNIKVYQDYGLEPEENGSMGFELSPVTVYHEGIFIGYRYFDTFGKEVIYPFGYGLSYTDFSIEYIGGSIDANEQSIRLKTVVSNKGDRYVGKEVVQVYLSKPDGILEQPYQELVTFKKTRELGIGESQRLELDFTFAELASYDQDTASYIIEQGYYYIRIGNSSRNTKICAKIYVPETIIFEKLSNQLEIHPANKGKIGFLKKGQVKPITYQGEDEEKESAEMIGEINPEIIEMWEKEETGLSYLDIPVIDGEIISEKEYKFLDVCNKKITIEEFVSSLSIEELAVLCNGYSTGKAFGGSPGDPKTIVDDNGNPIGSDSTNLQNDFISRSPAIKKRGIPSVAYKDGPAGIGYVAWPVGTMMASTWNEELLYAFGDAVGAECEYMGINVWLAPAINLHRNPIAGRNFEYYSEDPFLSGKVAVAVTNGVMENHHSVTVSAKHFVLNDQETYRRGDVVGKIDAVDSIAEERTIREIYLKPFEMLVKNTDIKNIMTSFNKINGTLAAASSDLNINILRGEWGFKGYLVTDWGDMDIVVDGADAVAAGNDVIMPGGPPVIMQVLNGYQEGRVNLSQLRRSAYNFLSVILKLKSFE